MARTQAVSVELRSLSEIFEESVDTLRQELSEYSFIALVGAVAGCLAVLICGVIDSAISLALVGPIILLSALLTMATCVAAFGCVNNHMQPDAGGAAIAMLRRLPALLVSWLPILVGLGAASYALSGFAEYIDRARIPDSAQVLALAGLTMFFVYPRSLVTVALYDDRFTSAQAQQLSAFIVRNSGRRVWTMWLIVLAPAMLMTALSLITTLDTVTGALITCFLVGAMPLAAAMTSLLFYDAASQIELAPTPAATAPRTARS
jgi:hypothetical protein